MKPSSKQLALLATVALTGISSPAASAASWKQNSGFLRDLDNSSRRIEAHPFAANAFNTSQSFRLFRGGYIRFDEAVAAMLRDQVIDPMIEIRSKDSTSAMALRGGAQSQDFRFFVGGIPLCDYKVRAHVTTHGDSMILGTVPDVTPTSPLARSDWPSLERSYQTALRAIAENPDLTPTNGALPGKPHLGQASRCLRGSDGSLIPVWQMEIALGNLPHEVLADDYRAYRIGRKYFDVTGSSNVYEFNVTDSATKDFDLPNLTGDGTLTSTYLTTYMANGNPRATNSKNIFNFSPSASEFSEVSAYTHAQTHLKFFESLGFSWYGPKPLEIRVHDIPRGEINNALFLPASARNPTPSILLGDGDGDLLTNLATDGDVVSHELGHFIVYQHLTSIDGESLVLHEGLADFFAFARTGNACLGESICPEGDYSACWPETKHSCLRTGETDLTYGSELWESLKRPRDQAMGHLHGQAISGLLWDMRKANTVPAADLTKLVLGAVSYFGDASGFRDFFLALLLSDKEFFSSKYFDKIKAAADARGFGELINDVTDSDNVPLPTGKNEAATNSTVPTSTTKKSTSSSDGNPFKCGTVTGLEIFNAQNAAASSALMLFLTIGLPLLVPYFESRRQSMRVQSRTKDLN
jgi:hypothetical protein